MQRKGMMVGSGKSGYYNVTGRDPMVHSLSARGIKQPQRGFMSINPAIRQYSNEKLDEGAVKEHIEHPKFTFEQARMIARDHLVHNPRAYGKWKFGTSNEPLSDSDRQFLDEITKIRYQLGRDIFPTDVSREQAARLARIMRKQSDPSFRLEIRLSYDRIKNKGGKCGGKHLFTKIQSPKSREEIVNELSKSLRDKGYTFNIGIKEGHIELGDVRLGDKKVAKEGYNVSPYTGRHGRILNWGNWVEVNNTLNDVLDKTGTSANVSSLKGKFKIRRGNVGVNEAEWGYQGSENVGSMMRPVSRFEAWESEGRPRKIRKR